MEQIVTPTTFAEAWVIILGIVAVFVQAVINQPTWPSNVKRAVTVVVAIVLAVIYMVATGAISVVSADAQAAVVYWFIVIAGIVLVAQVVYRFIQPAAKKVEVITSPGSLSTGTRVDSTSTTGSDPSTDSTS